MLDEILARKDDFGILVVDRGEFHARAAGESYFYGQAVGRGSSLGSGSASRLSPNSYRLLVHCLRGDGDAGTLPDIARSVWFYDSNYVVQVEKAWSSQPRRIPPELGNRIRKEVATLNRFLRATVGTELKADRSSHYRIEELPRFCLVVLDSRPA